MSQPITNINVVSHRSCSTIEVDCLQQQVYCEPVLLCRIMVLCQQLQVSELPSIQGLQHYGTSGQPVQVCVTEELVGQYELGSVVHVIGSATMSSSNSTIQASVAIPRVGQTPRHCIMFIDNPGKCSVSFLFHDRVLQNA